MSPKEFQSLTALSVSQDEFDIISEIFQNTTLSKEEFCSHFSKLDLIEFVRDIILSRSLTTKSQDDSRHEQDLQLILSEKLNRQTDLLKNIVIDLHLHNHDNALRNIAAFLGPLWYAKTIIEARITPLPIDASIINS